MLITRREILPLFAGAGLAAIGTSARAYHPAAAPGAPAAPAARAKDLSTLMEPGPMDEIVLGDENAPVTIVEYASMTCGFCARFHKETLPGIKEKYVDTGKVKFYFREYPRDPRDAAAFMLSRCVSKDRYFALVDLLYKQQPVWARSNNVVDELLKIAKLAGFTQASFEACLKNQELLDNVLAVQKKATEEYGVNSTPTFFINGTKYAGTMPVEQMSKIIDDLL